MRGNSSDNWQVGDLALCVRGGYISGPIINKPFPDSGALYTVREVVVFDAPDDLWLVVDGAPDNVDGNGTNHGPLWVAKRFTKVTPPEADEFDREVIEQMNSQPVPEYFSRLAAAMIRQSFTGDD